MTEKEGLLGSQVRIRTAPLDCPTGGPGGWGAVGGTRQKDGTTCDRSAVQLKSLDFDTEVMGTGEGLQKQTSIKHSRGRVSLEQIGDGEGGQPGGGHTDP